MAGRMAPLGFLFVVLAVSRIAIAEEPRRIDVMLAADAEVARSVLPVLRESLTRQGLKMVATVVPRIEPRQLVRSSPDHSAAGLVASLWLDLAATPAAMYLVASRDGLVYFRPLAVRARPDAVELELIRFVVDSAVQAILTGHPVGVSRNEFEKSLTAVPATTTPPAPVVSPPWPRWAIAAGYSGTMLSSTVISQGPDLNAELRWRRLRLGVTLSQQLPFTVTGAGARARLVSSGLRAFAAVPVAIGSHARASFGVGAGVDATHVAPEAVGATAAYWVTDPLLLALGTLQRALGRLIASVDVGVELDLVAARYSVIDAGATLVVWRPQRWRPFAAARVGLSF
jgi:hypothetical protein